PAVAAVAPAPEAKKEEPLPIVTTAAPPAQAEASTHMEAAPEPVVTAEAIPLAKARTLKKIETSGSGASIEVQLAADGDISYNAFKLANPARVVVDLNGVKDKLAKNVVDVGGDLVKKIRVAQFKGAPDPVTRVVFDLAQPTDFHVTKVGDKLQVSFGE